MIPLPKVTPLNMRTDPFTLRQVRFVDPDSDLVPGVIASASAPRVDPTSQVDESLYAYRAGLSPGESATVILDLEVRPDGTIGNVEVLKSSGSLEADEAAMLYVHMLHWIPGSVDRHARAMRVRWPVTLYLPSAQGAPTE